MCKQQAKEAEPKSDANPRSVKKGKSYQFSTLWKTIRRVPAAGAIAGII